MESHPEIWNALHRHLRTIYERDAEGYRRSVTDDLVIYEWYVTPHRQDGVGSHLFFIAESEMFPKGAKYHYELLEPKLQLYGEIAIACYTLMLISAVDGKSTVRTTNETRVLARLDGQWKVCHVHKSPTGAVA